MALGFAGVFPTPIADEELFARVRAACGQEPQVFLGGPGRGRLGRDRHRRGARRASTRRSRRASTPTSPARPASGSCTAPTEDGVHFVAAGHYATERFGVRSLGEFLGKRFDLEVRFFDLPNPV